MNNKSGMGKDDGQKRIRRLREFDRAAKPIQITTDSSTEQDQEEQNLNKEKENTEPKENESINLFAAALDGDRYRIKYLPIFIVLIAAVLLCFYFGIRYNRLRNDYLALQGEMEEVQNAMKDKDTAETGSDEPENDSVLSDAEAESSKENTSADSDSQQKMRQVYITFDDGPSRNTDRILDILDEYNVKATFFVCGKKGFDEEYKRIVEDGHTLAMHSYSHNYSELYESLDSFQTDLHKLQNYLYDITGVWSTYYRFPGGSSNTASKVDMQELIDYLGREHIIYYDWNIYGGDNVSASTIVKNVADNLPDYSDAVILMHDASDKNATVEALPQIIETILAMENTEIVPVTEDSVPVQHR